MMEMLEQIITIIKDVGFPIACVIALALYAKDTTDKIVALTEKVTNALVSSTNAIEEVKYVIKKFTERGE